MNSVWPMKRGASPRSSLATKGRSGFSASAGSPASASPATSARRVLANTSEIWWRIADSVNALLSSFSGGALARGWWLSCVGGRGGRAGPGSARRT